MIRLVGILVGLGFAFVVTLGLITGIGPAFSTLSEHGSFVEGTAEKSFHLHADQALDGQHRDVAFSHDGLTPSWDITQLQRGYQVYKEVCSVCHSLDYVAFRNLGELTYTEDEVKAEAADWLIADINPDTGEPATRPGLPTDYFPAPYANDVAAAAANNNAIPPDLSLMTKARHNGPAYVYALLTGYTDPAAHTNEAGETLADAYPDSMPGAGLYFNPYFANLNLAMAPPLSDGQITYADGTEATTEQMAMDVAAFLTWTAEPSLVERKRMGWPVMGFLLFATILAWLAKKQIWADKKPRRKD